MKRIGLVGYAQNRIKSDAGSANEVELIMPVVHQVLSDTNLKQEDIDFTCSGSCDYLQGAAFAFVEGLNAIQTYPPIKESHVEMDAAWALYESYLRILSGEAEIALIYGFGKSSPGNLDQIMTLQLDPYYVAPLWPDRVNLAALQANSMLQAGKLLREEMFEAVCAAAQNAKTNPNTLNMIVPTLEEYLASEMISSPLTKFDCAPISDGASAIIIASEAACKKFDLEPVWIEKIGHQVDSGNFGFRDLTLVKPVSELIKKLSLDIQKIDFIETHTQFSHEVVLMAKILNRPIPQINLSGGPLAGNVMMAAGLDAIGHAYKILRDKNSVSALAHASSGPCLQHNLLACLRSHR
ncbi:MAG: lipid-transfer protein [Gammaproteobacteria bacterium]